ncbi:6378_t:CDS:2, partial [Paraglomus brasilianum]
MARIRYRPSTEGIKKTPCWVKCYCFSCCIIILAAIAIPITIALLKKDLKIKFMGVIPSPDETVSYADNNTAFNANAGFLRFNVFNSLSVKTTAMTSARAYYYFGHLHETYYKDKYFGIGSLDVHLKAKSNATIDIPFSIAYSTNKDYHLSIINDIIEKCGFTGRKPQPLQIYYTAEFTQRIAFVILTINSYDGFTSIDCPFKDGKVPPIPGVYI